MHICCVIAVWLSSLTWGHWAEVMLSAGLCSFGGGSEEKVNCLHLLKVTHIPWLVTSFLQLLN